MFLLSVYLALVFGFLTTSLLSPQVITGVRNLIRQCAQLFYRLEAGKTMMAYIAHYMNDREDFHTRLETIKSDVIVARKLVEEGVGLLRITEEEKEADQAEAC